MALHWSLIVDCEEPALHRRIGHMQTQLYSALQEHNPAGHDAVNGQVRFKAFLDQFSKEVRVLLAALTMPTNMPKLPVLLQLQLSKVWAPAMPPIEAVM